MVLKKLGLLAAVLGTFMLGQTAVQANTVIIDEDFTGTTINNGAHVTPTQNLNGWYGFRWTNTTTGCSAPCSGDFARQNFPLDGNQTNLLVYGFDASGIGAGTMIDISLDYIQSDKKNGQVILAGLNTADGHDVDPYGPWFDGEGNTSDGLIFMNENLANTMAWSSASFWATVPAQYDAIVLAIILGSQTEYTTGIDNVYLEAKMSQVPEPATLGLIGLGLAGIGFARRRRKA